MSDKSELKAELERKKQRLAQIREEKKRKEEERKKKETDQKKEAAVSVQEESDLEKKRREAEALLQSMGLTTDSPIDFQKKQPDDDSTPSTSNSQSDLFSEETTSDNNNTSVTTPTLSPSQQSLPTELNVTSPSEEECGPCTDTAHVSLITPTKRSCGADSQSESEASPVKRPRLVENPERPEESGRSKQKSRRRCFQCQTKLELVQQELGSCRCGYVFCMLHRLPEQHDCTFDHMGRGREEAIMKMVKLDRKVGRSCQRIGEGCS